MKAIANVFVSSRLEGEKKKFGIWEAKNCNQLCRMADAKLPSGPAQQRELIIKVKGKKEEVDFFFFSFFLSFFCISLLSFLPARRLRLFSLL